MREKGLTLDVMNLPHTFIGVKIKVEIFNWILLGNPNKASKIILFCMLSSKTIFVWNEIIF